MKKKIFLNLHQNIISNIEEKDEISSNLSDTKNDDAIIIQTINRKTSMNKNKFLSSSKEMTTIDQIENSSNQKNSSNSYNINYAPNTFRFKHKFPYKVYQQWINQINQSNNNFEINNKDIFENKSIIVENKKKKNGNSINGKKSNKKCCVIF